MIKVLRFITRMNIGGPAIHVSILDRELDQDRFYTTLARGSLSADEGSMENLVDPWKPYYIVEGLQREIDLVKDIKAFRHILEILNQEQPDIIHTHTAKAGMLARLAAICYNLFHEKKIKIVHTYHGNVFNSYFGKVKTLAFLTIERILAKFTDVIIAISPSQLFDLQWKYKINAKSTTMIRLGFDLEPFINCLVHKGELREKYDIKEKYIVGIVGRLAVIKNHKMFIDVVCRYHFGNFPRPSVKFLIIGDGAQREELEVYARQKGVADRILFTGWLNDMPMVYADLDILCLTSKNEGTPVSIIEALASEVRVVATDVGGVKDLVLGRGILVPDNDVEEFVKGIEESIVDINKGWILQTKAIKEYYTKERLVKDIEELYERLVD